MADFVAWYDRKNKRETTDLPEDNCDEPLRTDDNDDNGNGDRISDDNNVAYRKRTKAKVLRWKTYKLNEDSINYMREVVTLFWPFQNEELDLLDQDAYIRIYTAHSEMLLAKRKQYESGLSIENVVYIINETLQATLEKETNADDVDVPFGPALRNVNVPYLQGSTYKPSVNEDKDIDSIRRFSTVRPVENMLPHAEFCALLRT